jgi:hypothetical protein
MEELANNVVSYTIVLLFILLRIADTYIRIDCLSIAVMGHRFEISFWKEKKVKKGQFRSENLFVLKTKQKWEGVCAFKTFIKSPACFFRNVFADTITKHNKTHIRPTSDDSKNRWLNRYPPGIT